jgi:putative transposase
MKANFTQEQIIKLLEEAAASSESVKDFVRRKDSSEWTFYRWRQKYSGMSVPQAARLTELERESARLKKLLVERDLEINVLKEVAARKW